MNVTINIFGAGTCDGSGEHIEGAVVMLYAVPVAGNVFKKFVIDTNEYLSNPKYFDAETEDVTVDCYFYTPFEAYIRGAVSFDIPDLTLNNIRISRGIKFGQDVAELSTEILDLALADVLMYGASRPSSVTGAKDSDGGWSHTDGSVAIGNSDRIFLRTRALDIYKKYGETTGSVGITFGNLNGVAYRR